MNRRSFFQKGVFLVAGLTALPFVVRAEERRRGGGASASSNKPTLVDVKDSAAKGVNYVEKNSDIKDANLKADRMGVKFKDQKCSSCAFYIKDKETVLNGKKAAPCQMPFTAGKSVTADGWCSSWAKK